MNWFALLIIILGVFLTITGVQGTYGQVWTFLTGQPLPFTVSQTGASVSQPAQQQAGPTPKNQVAGGNVHA